MIFQHDQEFKSHSERRCVKIFLNGEFSNGKDLHVESDWKFTDFLNACSQRLGTTLTLRRVFNVDGNDIDDCMMLEDNDILFLSNGDDFIPPLVDRKGGLHWDKTIPATISGYKIGSILGRGGFGEVRVGEHHLTGEKVALKFLRKSEIISMGAAERTTTEIQCLSALKHANIIRLQQHLESPHYVVLVFELMEGGDLAKFLMQRQKVAVTSGSLVSAFHYALPEDEARHVFGQILSAVGYAHNQHICHRDLKLENILLKSTNLSCVKIADFGLSAFYRPGAMMKSSCGTLSFLAPEVFAGTSNAGMGMQDLFVLSLRVISAGPPLDVWALGVILFAILCGRLPFEGPDLCGTKRPRDAVIRSRIMKGQYKIEEGLSPEAKVEHLVLDSGFLHINHHRSHYYCDAQDLVRRMLRVDPPIRASVPEIFSHVWTRTPSSVPYDASTASTTRDPDYTASPTTVSKTMSHGQTHHADTHGGDIFPLAKELVGELSDMGGGGDLTGPSSAETDYDPDDILTVDMGLVIESLKSKSPFEGDEEERDTMSAFDTLALGELTAHNRKGNINSPAQSSSSVLKESPCLFLEVDRAMKTEARDSPGITMSPPVASVVLMPLRRNLASSARDRDAIPSPRRPRTAMDEDPLWRPRSDSLDLLSGEKEANCAGASKTTPDGADDVYNSTRSAHSRQSLPNVRRPDHPSASLLSTPPSTTRKQLPRTLVRKSSSWTSKMEEFQLKEGKSDSNDFTSSPVGERPLEKSSDTPSSAYNSPHATTGRKTSALHFAGSSSLKSYGGAGGSNSSSPTSAPVNVAIGARSSARAVAAAYEGSPVRGNTKLANSRPMDGNMGFSNHDSPSVMPSQLATRKPSLFSKAPRRSSGGGTKGSDI